MAVTVEPRGRWAPPAPMPTEPWICRWCRGRLRAVLPGIPVDHCEAGCAPNDSSPYLGHCMECRREFHTGRRWIPSLCHACDTADRAATAVPDGPRVYSFKRFTRGGYID